MKNKEKKNNTFWNIINFVFLIFFLAASFYLSNYYSAKTYFDLKWFLFSTPIGLLSYIFIPAYWGNWFSYLLTVKPLKVDNAFELYMSLLFIIFSIIYLILFERFVFIDSINYKFRIQKTKQGRDNIGRKRK